MKQIKINPSYKPDKIDWIDEGDTVTVEESASFLYFWSIKTKRKYNVYYIGSDCSAKLFTSESNRRNIFSRFYINQKTVTGSVRNV